MTKKIVGFAMLAHNQSSEASPYQESNQMALQPPRNNFLLNSNPFATFFIVNDIDNE